MNLDLQKEHFKNHVATFTDYGKIKILDFKNPNSNAYRIRFLFEEDYCRLHISGDLGELSATNYNNMRYEHFDDFVNNVGYFEEKIDCHSRAINYYDDDKARAYLMSIISEYDLTETITEGKYDFETDEDKIEEFIGAVLVDFDESRGVGSKGYDALSEVIDNAWEIAGDIGKKNSGILDLYMMAFRLAKKQLGGNRDG